MRFTERCLHKIALWALTSIELSVATSTSLTPESRITKKSYRYQLQIKNDYYREEIEVYAKKFGLSIEEVRQITVFLGSTACSEKIFVGF
ncbi:MAG: hypothetical protein ACXV2C_01920 [Candidatus Bathyarchaeia archaeon]